MKNKYKESFRNIYKVIMANVKIIEDLVKESQELEDIIIGLSAEQSVVKSSLEKLKNEIYKSTENLVNQTKTLCLNYNDLLEEFFPN